MLFSYYYKKLGSGNNSKIFAKKAVKEAKSLTHGTTRILSSTNVSHNLKINSVVRFVICENEKVTLVVAAILF